MARVKGSNIHKNRRKKILKLAKGYFGSKHKLYKTAKEQVMHSLKYAYRDRKQNKREMRKLWITRINAACRMNEISYSKFISGLNKNIKKEEVEETFKKIESFSVDDFIPVDYTEELFDKVVKDKVCCKLGGTDNE